MLGYATRNGPLLPESLMSMPTRLYRARTVRIINLNCVMVYLDLGFGISLQKNLVVEGIDGSVVPPSQRPAATHCLVIIAGGRDLLVHTDDTTLDGFLKARVYLAAETPAAPEGTLAMPYGIDLPRMEVGLMWQWVARHGFDPRAVGRCLLGVPKGT